MKFKKKAIEVDVEFAKQVGLLATLEGFVPYQEGDAILTGIAKERWPIIRSRFESTYQPVHPTQMGVNGKYSKKPISVNATQTEQITQIASGNSKCFLRANIGDWIITDDSGEQWVVTNEIFLETYESI